MIADTLTNIPASLKARRQWICWKYKKKDNGDITKPPVSPHTGYTASATDPANWVGFDEAVAASKRFNLPGVGFALSPDDNLTGGDLDDCWNDNQELSDTARRVLDLAETYAERSPSGKGLRLIWEGKVPAAVKCDDLGIEMYGTDRYLTITGQCIENADRDPAGTAN
jgi:primase-polymerase (primpol)-like protein